MWSVVPVVASAREITLTWEANSEPDLSHYVVYWGTSSGNYTSNSGNIGLVTEYSVIIPDEGVYFFAVTAVDTAGLESDYSNEVNTLDDLNHSPILVVAFPEQLNQAEGGVIDLSNSSDEDGDELFYEVRQVFGPEAVLENQFSDEVGITFPSVSVDQTAVFEVETDDTKALEPEVDIIMIKAKAPIVPPILSVPALITKALGQNTFSFTAGGGLVDSFTCSQIYGPTVSFMVTKELNNFVITFNPPSKGNYYFRIIVSNTAGSYTAVLKFKFI